MLELAKLLQNFLKMSVKKVTKKAQSRGGRCALCKREFSYTEPTFERLLPIGQIVRFRSLKIGVSHSCERGVSHSYGTGLSHTCLGAFFG